MIDEQDNIFFLLDEIKKSQCSGSDAETESNMEMEMDMDELLDQISNNNNNSNTNTNIANDHDLMLSQIINYHENYTIKDLLLICDYYEMEKDFKIKKNKCNKDVIIHYIVEFESNPSNNHIVSKRQNMWFYMNELKNDKFMKKYVLW